MAKCHLPLSAGAVRAIPVILLLAVLVLLGGCGRAKSLRSFIETPGADRAATADSEFPLPSPANNFNTDGFTAGVDYYQDLFVVGFNPQAKATSAAGAGGAGAEADYDTASVLYRNPGTIALAREIRGRYSLQLSAEAHTASFCFASYKVDGGADARPVMEQILADYPAQVEYVQYSARVRPFYTPNDLWQWDIEKIECESAWDHEKGDPNVKVAVIDSGIRYSADSDSGYPDHEDLAANTINPITAYPSEYFDLYDHYEYPPTGGNWRAPDDKHGHGSHVSGTIAAVGNNGVGVVGVAYQCKLVPIRVFGPSAEGCPSVWVAAGLVLAADEVQAAVVNMSLGSTYSDTNLHNACDYANGKGCFLVASAGNDYSQAKEYPAAYNTVLSVGATKPNDDRASYSNYGSWVDIAAPGGENLSPPQNNLITSCSCGSTHEYAYMEGTSMACPHVAGAAALLKSHAPTLTNDEVRNLLVQNGPLLPSAQWANSNIHRLDVMAALTPVLRPQLHFPQPSPLVITDTLVLDPDVVENTVDMQYWMNDTLIATRTEAPWGVTINTSDISFGEAGITVHATGVLPGLDTQLDLSYIVDNTSGAFPLSQHYESDTERIASWANDYAGKFTFHNGGYLSSGCYGVHNYASPDYPNSLTSFAVMPLLSLPASPAPTMTLRLKYNLENGADTGKVVVSTDNFQTWTLAKQRNMDDAAFTGLIASWSNKHINLAPWAGQDVHVGFLLETNGSVCGEDGGQSAGWWIDQVVIAYEYAETVPMILSTGLPDPPRFGSVYEAPAIELSAYANNDAVTLSYELQHSTGTISGEAEGQPFEAAIDVSGLPNQMATLRLQAFDDGGIGSPELIIPVVVFNLRGDINGDGVVNDADRDALIPWLGYKPSWEGYLPWFDSDGSGIVGPEDIAAIGYFWGSSI
jgi:thermitase